LSGRIFVFPLCSQKLSDKREKVIMRFLRHILFTCAVVAGLAVGASAQKNDQKKPPPKGPPPVITPGDKNRPRENPPRNSGGDRGGKKPGLAFFVAGKEVEIDF
jgi:hypothetical protein